MAEGITVEEGEGLEAAWRSAVHLAYYAAYHLVAAKLGMETTGRDAAKHRAIANKLDFYRDSDPVCKAAKSVYRNIMNLRFRSDYNLAEAITVDDANEAVNWAYRIFEACAEGTELLKAKTTA
ncbi:HEPN domain-containing protein [Gluconobacter cerinus]|uniref:HEPN domain-containing protein n=1 Tax=Gluconobacter cerinus TaxID=38307 RepID=UPI001C04E657|nr:HEPN domain-containing protein [Gluconobacter cerinus]